jgi:hypothetical protein
MWLEDTLETHDENHKPVPFMISCPNCEPGFMTHTDWNKDIRLQYPEEITENMNHFENREDCDCGYPVFVDCSIPNTAMGSEQ